MDDVTRRRTKFLTLLEQVLEIAPGSLTGPETLQSLGWGSLSVLNFIALADDRYGVAVSPTAIAACHSVKDLAELVGQ